MATGREILLEHLHRLMEAEGWRKPDGEWDIGKLHKRAKGSKRWLYKVVRGETDFSIDWYESLLQKAFGVPFQFVLTGLKSSPIPRDVEDLRDKLTDAIANAKRTGTLNELRYALAGIFGKTAADRALFDKAQTKVREPADPSSRVKQEARGDPEAGSVSQKRKRRQGTG